MKPMVTLLVALMFVAVAHAGDVYVTRDAQGRPVYTDTPQTIPAQKVGVHSSDSDPAEVQTRYGEQMKRYASDDDAGKTAAEASKAREMTAEDRTKRCVEARKRYEAYMVSNRLYEQGPDGERRYLSSEEIDLGRTNTKQLMDQFCGAQ